MLPVSNVPQSQSILFITSRNIIKRQICNYCQDAAVTCHHACPCFTPSPHIVYGSNWRCFLSKSTKFPVFRKTPISLSILR
ncbi:hypothetical protein B566_EDAN004388 [Ephemera danica]|nr:hypothetical protein B566_EDAN004388 [Ephemera danica]